MSTFSLKNVRPRYAEKSIRFSFRRSNDSRYRVERKKYTRISEKEDGVGEEMYSLKMYGMKKKKEKKKKYNQFYTKMETRKDMCIRTLIMAYFQYHIFARKIQKRARTWYEAA